MNEQNEVADFYTALEHMMDSARADNRELLELRLSVSRTLAALDEKLALLESKAKIAAKEAVEIEAGALKHALARDLTPLVNAATTAKESFGSTVEELTVTLTRTANLTIAANVSVALAAVAGAALSLWVWLPQGFAMSEQTQIVQALHADGQAQAFFRDHAHVIGCHLDKKKTIPCVRVRNDVGPFSDAQQRPYYALDESP